MNIIAISILVIFAIIVIIIAGWSIADEKKSNNPSKFTIGFNILTIVAMAIGIILCFTGIVHEVSEYEYRYPAKQYKIETEITTRGEVSDTTYVITKIK